VIETIVSWLLIIFAITSSISKLIRFPAEINTAKQFGLNYKYINVLGVLQLLSALFIYFQNYFAGFLLLGVPYLLFVYLGLKQKNYVLSFFSLVIFLITLVMWLTFI